MKKIKLTKISDVEKPYHPNNIESGFIKEGDMLIPPTVGESFWVGNNWRTSCVEEVISKTEFKTMNSHYKIEFL